MELMCPSCPEAVVMLPVFLPVLHDVTSCAAACRACVCVCVVVLCGRVGVDRGGTQLRRGSQLSVPHKPAEQTRDRTRESGCFLESG